MQRSAGKKNKMNKRRGFTLSELLLSMAILAIAISGLLALSVSSLLLNESNKNLVTAVNDAEYTLEQIKELDYSLISSYTPLTFNNLTSENVTVSVSAGTKITGVTVNVAWTERQRQRDISLSTYIAR